MQDHSARRPARQRAASEQVPVMIAGEQSPNAAMVDTAEEERDPGGWLVIGMMILMLMAIGVITILSWQAA